MHLLSVTSLGYLRQKNILGLVGTWRARIKLSNFKSVVVTTEIVTVTVQIVVEAPSTTSFGRIFTSMAERNVGKPWSPQEDALLMHAITIHGEVDKWKTIALSVPGRTNKACRKVRSL
jgi:hypothetical protein